MVHTEVPPKGSVGSAEENGDAMTNKKKKPATADFPFDTARWRRVVGGLSQQELALLLTINRPNRQELYLEYLTLIRGIESGILRITDTPEHFVAAIDKALTKAADFWDAKAAEDKARKLEESRKAGRQ